MTTRSFIDDSFDFVETKHRFVSTKSKKSSMKVYGCVGHLKMVVFLLENKAREDVEAEGLGTAKDVALINGHTDICKLLDGTRRRDGDSMEIFEFNCRSQIQTEQEFSLYLESTLELEYLH